MRQKSGPYPYFQLFLLFWDVRITVSNCFVLLYRSIIFLIKNKLCNSLEQNYACRFLFKKSVDEWRILYYTPFLSYFEP